MGSPPPGGPKPGVTVPKETLQEWADEARAANLEKLAREIERYVKSADY